MTTTALALEINALPQKLREEVADFVAFLKQKHGKQPLLQQREYGFAKGKIQLSEDFDAPLEIFNDYM